MAIAFGRLFQRYSIVTLLPAFVVGTIYADYNHTQKFKTQRKENGQA